MTEPSTLAAPPPGQAGAAKRINLALQGGGSHGAYTWGVLDRLLEDHRIEIDSISATSAGAMNAAVLASGYSRNSRAGARHDLRKFWTKVGEIGRFSPFRTTPLGRMMDRWRLDNSPGFFLFDMMSRLISPYQNLIEFHPLRDVLLDVVDFDRIRYASGIDLYICATNVRTGKVTVFRSRQITIDVLLASACLPHLFRAVKIGEDCYWDGGYMGNPALWPLAYESQSRDLVLVQINPLVREEIPETGHEIQDRLDEINFNSTLMREMRALHFVNRLIDGGKLDPSEYRRTNIHLIDPGEPIRTLHASSKLNAEPDFLAYLFEIGRTTAERWIEENLEALGHRSSIDVAKIYL